MRRMIRSARAGTASLCAIRFHLSSTVHGPGEPSLTLEYAYMPSAWSSSLKFINVILKVTVAVCPLGARK